MNKKIFYIFISIFLFLLFYLDLPDYLLDSSSKSRSINSNQKVKNILWYDGKKICGTPYEMHPPDESHPSPVGGAAGNPITAAIFFRKNQVHLKGLAEISKAVELHGRVLDQDGRGIPDVRVILNTCPVVRLQDGNLCNPELIFEVNTDARGNFSISGFNSIDIVVADLKKEGYKASIKAKNQYHGTHLGAWGTEQSPVIFRMWRSQGAEPLIVGQSAFQVLSSNGAALTIDKITGYVKRIENPINIYLIRNDSTLEEGVSGTYVYDWSFKVEVPEGGVVLTDAEQAFYAPSDGYESAASYSLSKNSAGWSRQKKLTAYLVSGYPPKYSRLEFEIDSNNGFASGGLAKEGVVRWQIFTNPSGSRNLEYDPAKQIPLQDRK